MKLVFNHTTKIVWDKKFDKILLVDLDKKTTKIEFSSWEHNDIAHVYIAMQWLVAQCKYVKKSITITAKTKIKAFNVEYFNQYTFETGIAIGKHRLMVHKNDSCNQLRVKYMRGLDRMIIGLQEHEA